MPLSVSDMKTYLHVDTDAEDNLITTQMSAADKYISGKLSKTQALSGTNEAGEKTYVALADDPLYQQCIKLMVAHWYENREIVAVGSNVVKVDHTVDSILAHIQGCGDYI